MIATCFDVRVLFFHVYLPKDDDREAWLLFIHTGWSYPHFYILECDIVPWCRGLMISAYILIAMEPGYIDTSVKSMLKIDKVVKVSIVAGDFDIVVRVQVENLDELNEVTEKIQDIKGIHKTVTQVIEKEISL